VQETRGKLAAMFPDKKVIDVKARIFIRKYGPLFFHGSNSPPLAAFRKRN